MGWFNTTPTDGFDFSWLDVGIGEGSPLYQMLMATQIVPGDQPSYELCKIIYTCHPIGGRMAESPVKIAQSQQREIKLAWGPEEPLKAEFLRVWKELKADMHIRTTKTLSKVYGQTALVMGEKGRDVSKPIDFPSLSRPDAEIYFNVLDPLNTAGSLVLNQDPNAPDFLKPQSLRSGTQVYAPSRSVVVLNGPPIYIQWTESAYGFTGRSVYQRSLYALKTFLQTMITDDMVTKKAGLLIAKTMQAGSIVNNRQQGAAVQKRAMLQNGATGNVLTIGQNDAIETLNMQNLEGPARFARDNALKNCATGADMPAIMLNQDTLAEGFGEGTEDAKTVANFIHGERVEMGVLYDFFDRIAMRRAWTPEFYTATIAAYPDYKAYSYEEFFYNAERGFSAMWPNLLTQPDEEKLKGEKARFESLKMIVEMMTSLQLDPINRANLAQFVTDVTNNRKETFGLPLEFERDELEAYEPPQLPADDEGAGPSERLRVVK